MGVGLGTGMGMGLGMGLGHVKGKGNTAEAGMTAGLTLAWHMANRRNEIPL